jgi:hypothetical protein
MLMSPFMCGMILTCGRLVFLPDLDLGIRARFSGGWVAGHAVSDAAL